MATKFVANGNFKRTFFTPGGETGRFLRREAARVQHLARGNVGKSTGKLAKSIRPTKVTNDGPLDLEISVFADARKRGSKTSYALTHHNGSGPHVIQAPPGEALHWGGSSGPTVVAVIHPGSTGTYYLLKALNLVVGGMRA